MFWTCFLNWNLTSSTYSLLYPLQPDLYCLHSTETIPLKSLTTSNCQNQRKFSVLIYLSSELFIPSFLHLSKHSTFFSFFCPLPALIILITPKSQSQVQKPINYLCETLQDTANLIFPKLISWAPICSSCCSPLVSTANVTPATGAPMCLYRCLSLSFTP